MTARHSYTLSNRHDAMLHKLAKKLDISFVNTIERSLEALELSEAQRDQVVGESAEKRGSHL
jgi:hypothetical protein